MATYDVTWNDERGQQEIDADDVILEDGIYEFWRGDTPFLRAPADQVNALQRRAD